MWENRASDQMNTKFPFNRQKAAEAAAEFIRLAGGHINILKLTKLMYLLDRESLERAGCPVVGGEYLSMKHGPVTSQVLDAINGKNGEGKGAWSDLVSKRDGHEVSSTQTIERDHLSPFEVDLIAELHRQHEYKNQFELREWCHENCREWVKPVVWKQKPIVLEALAAEIKRTRSELEDASNEAFFMSKVFASS